MGSTTLRKWFIKSFKKSQSKYTKKVYFFFDEFTNYLDVAIGKKAITLLDRLGYEVISIDHKPSGRAFLSKGFLEHAKTYARANVSLFSDLLNDNALLVGVEPSGILSFRDEYPDLLRGEMKEKALKIAKYALTMEEFLSRELEKGLELGLANEKIKNQKVLIHGHCHQKAISSMVPTKKILKAAGYDAQLIPSGCCGMAGSFGYEKEHFEVSMKVGELVLFPSVRKADKKTIILASGTSCRHQILDGTGKVARHLVELL